MVSMHTISYQAFSELSHKAINIRPAHIPQLAQRAHECTFTCQETSSVHFKALGYLTCDA